jgi:ABC-type multidrug transport system fused ATPase/permease subunit
MNAEGGVVNLHAVASQRCYTLRTFTEAPAVLECKLQRAVAEWSTARCTAHWYIHLKGALQLGVVTSALITLIAVTAWQHKGGEVSPTDLIVFFFYVMQLAGRLQTVAHQLTKISAMVVGVQPFFELLKAADHSAAARLEKRRCEASANKFVLLSAAGTDDVARLRDVAVSDSSGALMIRGMNLSIPCPPRGRAIPGSVFALVGASGSGKSTVLKLLAGLHRSSSVVEGVVTLRQELFAAPACFIEQGAALFPGTVRENVAIAAKDAVSATDAAVEVALSKARCAGIIERLPRGIHSYLANTDHAGLSGGEVQRLCVARAFISNRPVVILDEPTTGLDPASAAAVITAVCDLAAAGRHVIIATHDVSAIGKVATSVPLNCAVLAEGSCTFEGTWKELTASAAYSQLVGSC